MPAEQLTVNIDQSPEGWNKIVSGYEEIFESLTSQYALDVFKLLNLKEGESVIDVGAGTGAFSLYAAKKGINVRAIDFAPAMIAKIKQRAVKQNLNNISADVMDGQALTLPDNSFDAGVAILSIVFFPDIQKGLMELNRVLRRPYGRAAVVCWNDLNKVEFIAEIEKAVRMVIPDFKPKGQPIANRLIGQDILKSEMEKAGFKNLKTHISTRSIKAPSPEKFWDGFIRSAPPLVALMERLDSKVTDKIKNTFIDQVTPKYINGSLELKAEGCIGIGTA